MPGKTVTKENSHTDKIEYQWKNSLSGEGLLENDIYSNTGIISLFIMEHLQKGHPPDMYQNIYIQDAIFIPLPHPSSWNH